MDRTFATRREAGKELAKKLATYEHRPDVLVLALPRGGVPVAYEVARALQVTLDVFLVRKLGVPGHEELAMGAIATGGVRVLDKEITTEMNIPEQVIDAVVQREQEELQRRERLYRGDRSTPSVRGRTVILVDDGMATGSSMRAAAIAVRQMQPSKLIVAVPVAAQQTCDDFKDEVDEVICALTPEPFMAVGTWYSDFSQTNDDEVRQLLQHAAGEQRDKSPVLS